MVAWPADELTPAAVVDFFDQLNLAVCRMDCPLRNAPGINCYIGPRANPRKDGVRSLAQLGIGLPLIRIKTAIADD